jgi:hypothetical protein
LLGVVKSEADVEEEEEGVRNVAVVLNDKS